MASKTVRDMVAEEARRARKRAGEERGHAKEILKRDADLLEGILESLKNLSATRQAMLHQAADVIAADPGDLEWSAAQAAGTESIEMLNRLGAGPDHDWLNEAQEAYAAAYAKAGHPEGEARGHAQFLREHYAHMGMGVGAIAQRLAIEAKRIGEMSK